MSRQDSGSGSPASGCTQNAPRVGRQYLCVGVAGVLGFPGQQLTYSVGVSNADSGCSSSSFVVKVSAPSGFAVSTPSTITVNSGSTGYVRVYVTSPATAADGDYPLTVTVERAGTPSPAAMSYYKVYSSDAVAPKLYLDEPIRRSRAQRSHRLCRVRIER